MTKKNIIICSVIIIAAICCSFIFFVQNKYIKSDVNLNFRTQNPHKTDSQINDKKAENFNETKKSKEQKTIGNESLVTENNKILKANLYNDAPSSAIPLSAIEETANLSQEIQQKISKIIENNNIYMLQKNNDKLLIITENPDNIRHNVEFVEIALNNGHQTKTTFGYNDKMKDSENDLWEYNNETNQPVRHTKYNSDGDMEFVEVWNYDADNPVKYEMKDSDGKVISMRKETLQDGTNLRIEHLLYDKDGNTKMNVSSTYEGQDIKRFTYYNADKVSESGSVFSDYSDGLKTKEIIYTSDLKVKNSYTSTYKDGVREEITKWDNQNNEVQKLVPDKDSL